MGEVLLRSHAHTLSTLMASAQTKGDLCDLELVCNGQTIMVHKLVACLQSPVIKAACTGSFKEASGRYEMKDCDFASVQRMVDFFYKGDYDAKSFDQPDSTQELSIHVAMFTLADKYLIDGLRNLSQTKFKAAVKTQEKPSVMPHYVKLVYDLDSECSRRLRGVVVEAVRLRVTALPFDLHVKKTLDGLMGDIPEFARDLAMSYIEQPQYMTGLFAGFGGGGYKKDGKSTTTAAPKFSWVSSSLAFGEAVDKKDDLAKKSG